jgi:enoyl-CoA hydratase
MELLVTGRQIGADEAAAIGLANQIVAPDELIPKGLKVGRRIAANGPAAVRITKQAIVRGTALNLTAALPMETGIFGDCFATPGQKEGMRAFLEKRAPRFKGG